MVGTLVTLVIVLAFVVLFGYLAKRAWDLKRRWLKYPGTILAGLLTLVATVVFVVGLIGFSKLNPCR